MKGRESPKRLSLLLFTGMGMRQNLSPSLPLSPSLSLSLSHTHTRKDAEPGSSRDMAVGPKCHHWRPLRPFHALVCAVPQGLQVVERI